MLTFVLINFFRKTRIEHSVNNNIFTSLLKSYLFTKNELEICIQWAKIRKKDIHKTNKISETKRLVKVFKNLKIRHIEYLIGNPLYLIQLDTFKSKPLKVQSLLWLWIYIVLFVSDFSPINLKQLVEQYTLIALNIFSKILCEV